MTTATIRLTRTTSGYSYGHFTVEPVRDETLDKTGEWHLFSDGDWCNTFPTLGAVRAAILELAPPGPALCRRCKGTGAVGATVRYGPVICSTCSGTGRKAAS